jgi:GFO/IDH/MocA oxidoreductase family protein
MKSIGFIDYSIDEYHANHYPEWIRESAFKDQIDVTLAWEEKTQKGKPLDQWCKENNVQPARSPEEIVDKCDTIIVLAPSNPEVHERLADLPLQSGKPVYIDKPFAPDLATAKRLFEKAAKHHTPLMSCSGLRYTADLLETGKGEPKVQFASTIGGGSSFWEYSIHQLEMLVILLGTGATRVMQTGNDSTEHMVIEYPDQRSGCMTHNPNYRFAWDAITTDGRVGPNQAGNFWANFIHHLLEFLITGTPDIDQKQTLEIATLVEYGIKALKTPNQWLELPR